MVNLPMEVLMFMKVYGWREVMDGWGWDIQPWMVEKRKDRYKCTGIINDIMLAMAVCLH